MHPSHRHFGPQIGLEPATSDDITRQLFPQNPLFYLLNFNHKTQI